MTLLGWSRFRPFLVCVLALRLLIDNTAGYEEGCRYLPDVMESKTIVLLPPSIESETKFTIRWSAVSPLYFYSPLLVSAKDSDSD
jgi:hypothetical protein